MRLTSDEVQAAMYALHDLVSRRTLANRPVPREVMKLYRRIEAACACESESACDAEQLDPSDLIDTGTAAEMLGCSTARVKQIQADLDGVKVGRDWVFLRHRVVEYAEAKGVGDDGNRVSPSGGGAVSARVA